jgi:hypothetical protein
MNGLAGSGRRRSVLVLALVVLLGTGGALVAWATDGHGQPRVSACRSQLVRGVLPVWARAGFSNPRPRGPYVLGAAGKLAALLWANPLLSPPPTDHNNKILWVARVPDVSGAAMRISAQRMIGSTPVGSAVGRKLIGGPGPSIVNLPAAGCWRFTLRWGGHRDTLDLNYASNG